MAALQGRPDEPVTGAACMAATDLATAETVWRRESVGRPQPARIVLNEMLTICC